MFRAVGAFRYRLTVSAASVSRNFATLVHGSGKLGSAICKLPNTISLDHRSTAPLHLNSSDVIVDVSLPAGLKSLISRLIAGKEQKADGGLPIILVGTTGDLPLKDIELYAEHAPVYICPNFSPGIRMLMPTMKSLGAATDFTTAVTEVHHTKKMDAPSGTAAILARALQTNQVSSIRAADVKGIHRIDAISELESIEIIHTAHDRSLFANGAVNLANELTNSFEAGNLSVGVHDPFQMLPSTNASTHADTASTIAISKKSSLSISTSSPTRSNLKMNPTLATQRIQSLRLLTAIKTPYNKNGRIDLGAYDCHVEHQIANGVEGLVVGGTTGEGHLLTWNEHIMLIAHTKTKFGDKIAVIGNTGSNSTGELNQCTAYGFAAGMDAALTINPYYGRTSEEGIFRHIELGMKYGPSIIYNVPGRTGQDIKPDLMYRLAEHPNFAGVKECMGPDRIREYTEAGLKVWSGNDDDMHFCRHVLGAQGSISVASNVVPGIYRKLLFGSRDDELNAKLAPLIKWLFKEPNPIALNTLLMQLGVCKPTFRLPYLPLDKSSRMEAVNIIQKLGHEHVVNGHSIKCMEDKDFNIVADYV